jgi:hypothetical protein
LETRRSSAPVIGDGAPGIVETQEPVIPKGFRIGGERVEKLSGIKKALANAAAANREGRPYFIDAVMARRGLGAESTWHPDISIARMRAKKV